MDFLVKILCQPVQGSKSSVVGQADHQFLKPVVYQHHHNKKMQGDIYADRNLHGTVNLIVHALGRMTLMKYQRH